MLLALWEETLAALAADTEWLVGRVDWITKRWLLQQFCDREQISWSDPWLKSQDLEYHQIDPARASGCGGPDAPAVGNSASGRRSRRLAGPGQHPRLARSRVMRLLQRRCRA